ncbi:unnamed protein product [Alternaria alternata]
MAGFAEDTDSDGEEEVTQPQLRTLLSDKLIKSAFDKTPHKFIPEGIVHELITEERIKVALGIQVPSLEETKVVDFVRMRAKKIFAILVYIRPDDIRSALSLWIKNDMDDSHLPISFRPTRRMPWLSEFCDEQWKFLAPVFSSIQYNHNLEEAHILPFVSKASDSGRGSFGVVSQYVVHKKHIDLTLPEDSPFAVKEIQAADDAQEVAEHWEKEVKALRAMNELNQDHIVRFITAFRRRREHGGQDHYLMFEWADGGNLRSMWKREKSPNLTAALVKDAMSQILGLARALEAAHKVRNGTSYRHGDLKPENILCFNNGHTIGTLKIGDWGEAKEHDKVTEMRPSKTTAKYGTRLYEAPEVETGVRATYLGQSTKRRSRLYDIWAMGCITLEFTIWLLKGHEGLTDFRRDLGEGSFYEVDIQNGKKVAYVHRAAIFWMDRMAEDPRCQVGSTAIGNLLELVRTALLVVKLPRRLATDASEQPERRRTDSGVSEARFVTNSSPANDTPFDHGDIPDPPPAPDVPSLSITLVETEPGRMPLQPEPEGQGPARCLATDFRFRMEELIAEDEDELEGYWDTPWEQPSDLRPSSDAVLPPSPTTDVYSGEVFQKASLEEFQLSIRSLVAPTQKRIDYAPPDLDEDDWKYQSGNDIASTLFASLRQKNVLEPTNITTSSRLCPECTDFQNEVFSPGFSKSYNVGTLRVSAESQHCDLCVLLWRTVNRNGGAMSSSIKFDRTGPFLRMKSNGLPVLSIVHYPSDLSITTSDTQMGFVQLPEAGSNTHLEVIQHWLHDCDHHHNCSPSLRTTNRSMVRLPTRLIDVGSGDDEMVRLWETKPSDVGEWIALSHKWGTKNLSTTPETLQNHLNGIDLKTLPDTFKDAVKVTRALGRRHLWIDSLCVIQGPGGDFVTEAKRMEEVYSGAYCVVAASCAADHYDGFLKIRGNRDYVGLCDLGKDRAPFYVCQNLDSFKDHVLDGELHSRGWVLQEHALARRTLFFTEHQTYFECSHGVRCETSTKLSNPLAAFLGDPDFPHIISNATQGEKILRYQELYRKFSRLGLSKPYDRPTAIDGLQQRLLRTMRVKGGFGMFDEGVNRGLLRRSLLWRRGTDTESLSRIHFPTENVVSKVPSWSWMAYTGGIDYLQPDFGSFEWEELQSPWSSNAPKNVSSTDFHAANITLNATAREYDYLKAMVQGEGELILDVPNSSFVPQTLCVVLGKAKGCTSPETQRHYVLIITATKHSDRNGDKVYERVGTGFLPGKCISTSGFKVKIQ